VHDAFTDRATLTNLQLGGLIPLTSSDYPSCLAAVVFCQGCPWRCGYCHNPHLIPRHGVSPLKWTDVINFLHRRQGLLDAVVFSGGEPTLQSGIKQAMTEVRELGFRVGLHTNGAYPSHLAELLPLTSWVGMDIKSTFANYDRVTGTPTSGEKSRKSAQLLLASGVPYEFRTTVHPIYHSTTLLLELAEELQQLGAKHYMLQEFRPQGCADEAFKSIHGDQNLLKDLLCNRLEDMFESFTVRRN